MQSKDIIAILKAAKGTGISKIVLDGLTLEFNNLTSDLEYAHNSTKNVPFNRVQDLPTAHEISEISDMDELDKEEKEEILSEFEAYQLMVNDPVEFEEYQRKINNV